jgi:hypothetical protein
MVLAERYKLQQRPDLLSRSLVTLLLTFYSYSLKLRQWFLKFDIR